MPPEPPIQVPAALFREMLASMRAKVATDERRAASDERKADAQEDAVEALRDTGPLLRELLDRRAADEAARVVAAREEGHRAGVEEGLRRAARAVEDERRRQIADLVSGSVDVVRKYVGNRVGFGLLIAALSALAGWFGVDVMATKAGNAVEVGDADPSGS